MKGLVSKRQILAKIIFVREVEMAKASRGKPNADCMKNYQFN